MKTLLRLLLITLLTTTTAIADERAKDVETFMERYLQLWNAGDAATITTQLYRFDMPNAFGSLAGLQAEFNRLKASGYSHSEKQSIKGCWINAVQAIVELRYTRLKTDGSAMPPKDRGTLYFVKKTADGLRINHFIPINASTQWSCASYSEQ